VEVLIVLFFMTGLIDTGGISRAFDKVGCFMIFLMIYHKKKKIIYLPVHVFINGQMILFDGLIYSI
jgi:hypothetical protein